MTYAFTFDASACSGCKACQVACKDKNNLPTGVLWRRVYEISGGSWTNVGAEGVRPGIWETDVFAYNLSIACNHCVHPKCAGVCPVDAYVVRPDGIVYIDETKCMGCGYCAWACPYSAPRYNPDLKHMTKCNFCHDNLDSGLPPACVAACPMRVLDYTSVDDGPQFVDDRPLVEDGLSSVVDGQKLWAVPGVAHPFPLPKYSRTQPHLAVKPHIGMLNGLEKAISNREEVSSKIKYAEFQELPLVIFTLSAQMAAGMMVYSVFFETSLFYLLAIGALLAIGGLFSFLHLGTKKNAWRGISHLKKSWLSREILAFGLFGFSWLALLAEARLLGTNFLALPASAFGVGLVYSMAQVYRIRAVPEWNTWRTQAAFFLSAGVLGSIPLLWGRGAPVMWNITWGMLVAGVLLALSKGVIAHEGANRLRAVCLVLAMVGVGVLPIAVEPLRMWLLASITLLISIAELVGRWLFYELRLLRQM